MTQLPPNLLLPFDVQEGIEEYCEYMKFDGVFEDNKLTMIGRIPLLEQYETFDLCCV